MYCVPEKENSLAAYKDKYVTLQQLHPEWEPHDLRVHTAQELLPQNLANQVTADRENQGLAMYEVPEAPFTVTETGEVWYTKYGSGVGLVDLSERQKRLTPDKYSSEEHATSLLIEHQFQEGAAIVATSYGGRDIVIMEYDPITKEGKTTVINTAVLKEAQDKTVQAFMQEYFPALASVFVTDSVFLFSDKVLSLAKAKEIVRPVLKDTITKEKKQFVKPFRQENRVEQRQDEDMASMPLPFLSRYGTDAKEAVCEDAALEIGSVSFIVKQEETHPLMAVNKQQITNLQIEDEQKTLKSVEVEVEETYIQPQKKTFVEAVIFQYKKIHEKSEHIQQTVSQPLHGSVPVEQTQKMTVDGDTVMVRDAQKVDSKQRQEYAKDPQSNNQKIQTEIAQRVLDEPSLMPEAHAEHVDGVQYKDCENDIVVQETLEEYFSAGAQEAVVEMEPAEVYQLVAGTVQEESYEAEKLPKDVKKVRKLCWILPLTKDTEQPEMLEVEMPKDQNQRLYNLLHFLRKIVRISSGNDVIRERMIQRIATDNPMNESEELEEYIRVLRASRFHGHMFAMVS